MATVRRAGIEDLEAVTAVFLDCWHLSYAEVMPAALVEGMTPERAEELWRKALGGGTDSYLAAVDGADGRVTGFAGYRLEEPGVGYVSSLYVSPRAQGGGYGRLLLARCEEELRRLGAGRARLWVFEQNGPSRAFYARQGWGADGRRETLAEWGVPQIGMAKELGAVE